MYSEYTRGHSVSCKMQRNPCKSYDFFSPRHPMREIKPPYSIFNIYRHACKNSHVAIIAFLFTVQLPLTEDLNMRDSQVIRLTPPTLPSLFSILKDFPVRQYVQAACDTEGTSIILILCVCSFLPEHEINLRGAPNELVKTLLLLMTDVISEGSGEHVCQGLAHLQSLK